MDSVDRSLPPPEPAQWVEVDCPSCGNVNRAARRQCRRCNHTGKVLKSC